MGWLRFDEHGAEEHEGFVRLMVQQPLVSPYWLPVGAVAELDYGRREIPSDELVMGVRSEQTGNVLCRYKIQIGCECGWGSPLLPVPLGTTYWPCSVGFSWESDEAAAQELWARFHRDHVAEWPESLTRFGSRTVV